MKNPMPEMQQQANEQSPMDDLISTVDSYIKDPTLVTPQTLMELRDRLEMVKADVEGETEPPPEGGMSGDIRKAGAY